MMDSIRAAAASVCLTLLVTGIFSMLVPNHNLEHVLRFAVSLFFLSSLIIPFVQGEFDFSLEFSSTQESLDIETLQEKTEQNFKSLAEKRLMVQIENSILRIGTKPKNIELSIHIEEDSRITISTVKIYLEQKDAQKQDQILTLIQNEIGMEPTVIIEDE